MHPSRATAKLKSNNSNVKLNIVNKAKSKAHNQTPLAPYSRGQVHIHEEKKHSDDTRHYTAPEREVIRLTDTQLQTAKKYIKGTYGVAGHGVASIVYVYFQFER